MKRNNIMSLAVALLFAACSQEDLGGTQGEPMPPGQYPIELTAGGLDVVATPAQASTRGTVDNDWKDVTTVAVQVRGEVKPYTATSTDGGQTVTLSSKAPFYWQSTSETITAWHPSSDTYPTWTVKADQSTAANYQASDLIKGELTLNFADRNNAEKNKIPFEHQTAKVVVELTAPYGFALDEHTIVRFVNVGGVENNESTVTAYRPDDGKQTYLALLTGQTIEANKNFIQITANGTNFYYKPEADKELQAGTVYTYKIRVQAEDLDVTVTESMDWDTNGATGGGSVEIP